MRFILLFAILALCLAQHVIYGAVVGRRNQNNNNGGEQEEGEYESPRSGYESQRQFIVPYDPNQHHPRYPGNDYPSNIPVNNYKYRIPESGSRGYLSPYLGNVEMGDDLEENLEREPARPSTFNYSPQRARRSFNRYPPDFNYNPARGGKHEFARGRRPLNYYPHRA